jgi:hypothetical protein
LPIFLDFEESFSFRISKRVNLLEPDRSRGSDQTHPQFFLPRPQTCLEAAIRDAIMQALSFL